MPFAPSEVMMWADESAGFARKMSDYDINAKYSARELRIVTESNREQLPNFVAALKRPEWLRLQPFYQRRKRWDIRRKSKLIESFIMNVPIPPCFLYESELARYEVMDGQQRISTVFDFYEDKFKLVGLDQWPELNERKYSTLPSEIRKGLDRRSISYIVLLKESAKTNTEEMLLRQQVFERLNTGGVQLESQEVRHCVYYGSFDRLLYDLAKHQAMRKAWGLPPYDPSEEAEPPETLLSNPHFSKMRDSEFVLRFFALRHREHYRGGMKPFLDQYMVRSRKFSDNDIEMLENLFVDTIDLAENIYGEQLFKPWVEKHKRHARIPQVAFADAVMVGLSEYVGHRTKLLERRAQIAASTDKMVTESPQGTFTGKGNSKAAIQLRVGLFDAMLREVLAN